MKSVQNSRHPDPWRAWTQEGGPELQWVTHDMGNPLHPGLSSRHDFVHVYQKHTLAPYGESDSTISVWVCMCECHAKRGSKENHINQNARIDTTQGEGHSSLRSEVRLTSALNPINISKKVKHQIRPMPAFDFVRCRSARKLWR